MMGTTTLSTNNVSGKNAALLALKTLGEVRNSREKLLQFGDDLVNTTDVNRSTANMQTNSTTPSQFILYQGPPIYIEGASEAGISPVSGLDFLSLEETTKTYILNKRHPAMIILGILTDSDVLPITKLVDNLMAWEWTTSIEDAYIRAYHAVVPKISIEEEESEEREWDTLFAQPHVQAGLDRLEEEAMRQIAAGEIEEGGFAVE